jgi:hypothetical protein
MLTQVIIERYATQSFAAFVSARIFAPLNMTATTYSVSAGEAAGTAAHAFTKAGRRIPTWLTDAEIGLNAGPGGVVSSTHDLARWAALLLGHGSEAAKEAVPAHVLDDVMGPQALIRLPHLPVRNTYTYGFGWLQWTHRGYRVRACSLSRRGRMLRAALQGIRHNGGVPGVSTDIDLFPDDALGIIVLCNADDHASMNQEIALMIADAVFGTTSERDAGPPFAFSFSFALRSLTPMFRTKTIPSGRPPPRVLDLPVAAVAGTYSAPAYGSFTLCTAASTSPPCLPVLAAFATVAPLDPGTLYASWPRLWSAHLRVVPNSGTFEPTSLFPAGHGGDTRPFESRTDAASVELDVDEGGRVRGMGVSWDDWPAGREGSVQERAQVWFRRVDT